MKSKFLLLTLPVLIAVTSCQKKENKTAIQECKKIEADIAKSEIKPEVEEKKLTIIDSQTFIKDEKAINTVYVSQEKANLYKSPNPNESEYFSKVKKGQALKLLAIGNEVELDGIRAPMLEVFYPQNKSYKWIFAGDVQTEKEKFSTAGWTSEDLEEYLSSNKWGFEKDSYENFNITSFSPNNDYKSYLIETSASKIGSWEATEPDTIEISQKFIDDAQEEENYTRETYKLTDIKANSFQIEDKIYYRVFPSYDTDKEIESTYNGSINVIEQSAVNKLYSIDYADFILTHEDYIGANDGVLYNNIKLLVENGVPVDHIYFDEYINYWYPIMEEEQKKNEKIKLNYPKVVYLLFHNECQVELLENLRIRTSESRDSQIITTIKANSKGYIEKVGHSDCIDNIYSQWVQVRFLKGEAVDRDGNELTEDYISGWCFGGYLNLLSFQSEE